MMSSGSKIIGGLLGLEVPCLSSGSRSVPFSECFRNYFLSARCAIYTICQSLKPRTTWLPSYLCGALLEPFDRLNIPIRFYDDGPNFQNGSTNWIDEVKNGDLVLFIHYFGFPNRTFPAEAVKKQGGLIVEDASQGLFVKQLYSESECIIYSPRKFVGVPDGGVVVHSDTSVLQAGSLEPAPAEWWKSALAATLMRREFDLQGGENVWFQLFREVEETFPVGPYCSSDLARMYIEGGTDYDFIERVRRENYKALLERLAEFALFCELDAETVPLGFPVRLSPAVRDRVLDHLYKQNIFTPVHWRIGEIVPVEHVESHLLSQSILTLICDQRYTTSDMNRQVDAFLTAFD
jgi:hypothetical protein